MAVWNPEANEIYLTAVEIEPPDLRRSYLEGACQGNAHLRGQVEALIAGPLLLPTLIILCLGLIKALWQAFEEKSWPEASTIYFTAGPFFLILILLLKIRKSNVHANHP